MRTREPPAEVREVENALVASLGDDLRALLWHGSFVRGEAKPDSDHDLIVILSRVNDDVLLRLRGAFRGRANWSTLVQSEEELRQFSEDGRLQFHFGFVPLFGNFEPPPWTRENILGDVRSLARNIRFECRYRLLHKEPEYASADRQLAEFQHGRNLRMLRYAAKWAILALKARELLHGRSYPETRAELRQRLADPEDIAIVDLVESWSGAGRGQAEDITPLALQLDAFARRLVAHLPNPSRRNSKPETRRSQNRVSNREFRVAKRRSEGEGSP